MPNKPHPPRKTGKKSTPSAVDAGDDTSFIVFGNGNEKKKKPKPASPADSGAESSKIAKGKKDATTTEPPAAAEAPKKPDTRTLIGGASWTGKLPMNLLGEHCQKQKWDKPEYTMSRSSSPPGFWSSVILRQRNNKTQEVTTLPAIQLPADMKSLGVKETGIEARHFAATYALFRIASGKNLHMMMPPQFRDLWKGEFADIKKEMADNGQSWLFEADPFVARSRKEEDRRIMEKKRTEKEKKIELEKKENGGVLGLHKGKGWSRAPKVDMGKKMRREIERLVREHALWNPHDTKLSPDHRRKVVDEVGRLGFRKAHVEEAMEVCKDKEEALEWLLVHVPEDDLPKWTLPEGYTAGISLASGDLRREGKIKRLSIPGYALELCEDALDACGGEEGLASERLQSILLADTTTGQDVSSITNAVETLDISAEDADVWEEEQAVLASIFGPRYHKDKSDNSIVRVQLEVAAIDKGPVLLHVRKPRAGYPQNTPVLGLEADLPSYIRLSILKQVCHYASTDLRGEQMLFNLVDWLENEIPRIIESPGRLSSIASAASTSADNTLISLASRRQRHIKRTPKPINYSASPASKRLLDDWQARQALPAQQRMLKARQGLPAWKLQEDIVEAVNKSQVTIISGETGSGKSTQSVQFILDDMIKHQLGDAANIICTQPRRISALGLADRVAEERCAKVGEEVGYIIRGESKQRAGLTKITFVTTGVLLRRLQTSGGRPQDVVDALADVSHVVIDEVHERSLDTDFLMVLLRDVLKVRKDLKLILMSATLDAAIFEKYFASSSTVSKIEIQGRTHPVQDYYLDDVVRLTGYGGAEDMNDDGDDQPSMGVALRAVGTRINYDLISQTVQCIDQQLGSQDGGILIFLPGVGEIDRTMRSLRDLSHIHALPLHSQLQSAEQKRVFPPAPAGKRKVIVATNVAETSITIEDIVAVIDTGRVKETSFDPVSSMVKLEEVWASRAACKQRRGRAGRVRAGICYKLYTRSAETNKMAERPEPEIKRVPLEQLCLSVKAMGTVDVPAFLASALTPPGTLAVEGALDLLRRMGALDDNELTALGRHLSMIPADLRCGKLLVYGAIFGCLEACLTIAAILTVRSPFISPQPKREEAKAARATFGDSNNSGDLICDLRAFEAWSEQRSSGQSSSSTRYWCESNFLSQQTLFDISTNRTQYLSSLQEIGFLPHSYRFSAVSSGSTQNQYNHQNTNLALLRALVAASFTPQLATIDFPDTKYIASVSGSVALDPEARTIKYFDSASSRVFVHPSSILFTAQTFPTNTAFVSYFTKLATSKVFVRDLTPFNAYTALLFCGKLELDTAGRGLLVDGWMRVRGWARIGVLVSRLRGMLDEVLAKKIDEPSVELAGNEIVGLVRRLVELDGMDR